MTQKTKSKRPSGFAGHAISAFTGAAFSSLGGYAIHRIVDYLEDKNEKRTKTTIGFDMKGEM